MKVREIMTRTVDSVDAGDTIAYVAARMAEDDIGALPVLSAGKLVGMITDRDIAVRAVGLAVPLNATAARIMSHKVATCSAEDEVENVLALMSRARIRRLPVVDNDLQVVGIVGLSDFARVEWLKRAVVETLSDISEPSVIECHVPVFA